MSGYIGTQPVPQATQTRDSFTCTAGQTSFATSGYTPNFLDVYLNGVKLTATDYTASNGSDVVLASGAATGDVLEVVAYTAFEAANVTGADDFTVTGSFTSQGIDDNATSTAMTLDASGNLLVGKASADSGATAGIETNDNGRLNATRNGSIAGVFNRLTSDGDIVQFRRGTTVGSIGSEGGNSLYINSGDTGLRFSDPSNAILPVTTAGAARDNAINLGTTGARFKDLYLSGGVYLGGTGSANKLDDYEEGTWTPTLPNGGTLTNERSTYIKIGNKVTATTYISRIDPTGNSSQFRIGSLPFTNVNTSNYYVGGSFGYTGQNNLSDLLPITGVNLDYIYFHENDGLTASATNNTMRTKGLTGDAADAMILTITYFT